jgi:hypothetical protein
MKKKYLKQSIVTRKLRSIIHLIPKLYYRIILSHPVAIISLLVLILLFFSYNAKDFKLDASADTLILENDKDLKLLREITERYNIKQFLFITFTPTEDLFTKKSIVRLKQLREKLLQLERVDSVITILDVPLLKTSGVKLSEITTKKLLKLDDPETDLILAKNEILTNPIYKNLILSPDGQTTGIQVNLKTDQRYSELQKKRNALLDKKNSGQIGKAEEAELKACQIEYEKTYELLTKNRHQDITEIRKIIALFKNHGKLYLGGVPMISDDTIAFVRNDLIVFGFGVFIFIVATLTFVFREIRWVVLPLLSCFFSVIIMIGMLGFLGWKVTVLSSNFISLMLILTLSMNIHLAVRYKQLLREMPSSNQIDVVFLTVRRMVWPCYYTALTTILAFSSLVLSGIKPVIDFGWMMTIGLTVTFLTSFLLFPTILVLLKKTEIKDQIEKESVVTKYLAVVARSHGGKVIFAAIILAIISLLGVSKLKVENGFINYFSSKTEIYQGMKLIDEKLGGTFPLEVILKFDAPETVEPESDEDDFGWDEEEDDASDYWFTPYKIDQIKEVHDYLDSLPEIGKVRSIASIVRTLEQLNNGKELSGLELSVLNKKIPDDMRQEVIDPYVSVDDNEARISMRILDSLEGLRRGELIKRIQKDLKDKFGLSEDKAQVAGMLVLYNNMLKSLFRSQILTLGIVLFGIAVMLLILFRSISLAIIGIIPNLLAVGIVLGIMGLFDIPLDLMTITIAAITMGIAIDNSIHYIYRFKEEFSKNKNYLETIELCHRNIGRAIVNTSITIIFGFSILVLSNFIPTIYFGVLTGLAMLIAMLAILTLLPRLILIFKPF